MTIPGFTAEASLLGTNSARGGRLRSNPVGQIIPALPLGGLAQLACVRAICKMSPSQCGSAWRICDQSVDTPSGYYPGYF
jgi:hypothetical protein